MIKEWFQGHGKCPPIRGLSAREEEEVKQRAKRRRIVRETSLNPQRIINAEMERRIF